MGYNKIEDASVSHARQGYVAQRILQITLWNSWGTQKKGTL